MWVLRILSNLDENNVTKCTLYLNLRVFTFESVEYDRWGVFYCRFYQSFGEIKERKKNMKKFKGYFL